MSSTFLPSTINQAINEFNDTIDRDIDVMFKVLNDQFRANKMAFVQRDTFSEPFYGRIEGFYWSEFEPLEPKAKKITQEIRNYLNVR
jgi:hypothetical protein